MDKHPDFEKKHLKLFQHAEDEQRNPVSIKFGHLLPMLTEAISSQRSWVTDFEDEEIIISADLFDVIQASRYFDDAA